MVSNAPTPSTNSKVASGFDSRVAVNRSTTSWAARTTVSKHAWLRPRWQQPQAQLTAQWSGTGGQAHEQTAGRTGTYRFCAAKLWLSRQSRAPARQAGTADGLGWGAGCLLCGQVGQGHPHVQLARWHHSLWWVALKWLARALRSRSGECVHAFCAQACPPVHPAQWLRWAARGGTTALATAANSASVEGSRRRDSSWKRRPSKAAVARRCHPRAASPLSSKLSASSERAAG